MCDNSKDYCGSNSLLTFLLGLGIGGVLGILYAPSSGEETRRKLKYYAEETSDKISKKTQELKEDADAAIKKVSSEIKIGKEKIKAAIDAGKNVFKNSETSAEEV